MPRVWSLPKGHVEARETHEQAALREVREETGCWAEILIKLSDISYWFYLNRTQAQEVGPLLSDALSLGRHGQPRPRGRRGPLVRDQGREESAQVRQREAPGRPRARVPRSAIADRDRRASSRPPSTSNPVRETSATLTAVPASTSALLASPLDVFDGPLDLLLISSKSSSSTSRPFRWRRVADQYFAYISRDGRARRRGRRRVSRHRRDAGVPQVASSLLPPIPPEFVVDGEESAGDRSKSVCASGSSRTRSIAKPAIDLRRSRAEAAGLLLSRRRRSVERTRPTLRDRPRQTRPRAPGGAALGASRRAHDRARALLAHRANGATSLRTVRRDGRAMFFALAANGSIAAASSSRFSRSSNCSARRASAFDQSETLRTFDVVAIAPVPAVDADAS